MTKKVHYTTLVRWKKYCTVVLCLTRSHQRRALAASLQQTLHMSCLVSLEPVYYVYVFSIFVRIIGLGRSSLCFFSVSLAVLFIDNSYSVTLLFLAQLIEAVCEFGCIIFQTERFFAKLFCLISEEVLRQIFLFLDVCGKNILIVLYIVRMYRL